MATQSYQLSDDDHDSDDDSSVGVAVEPVDQAPADVPCVSDLAYEGLLTTLSGFGVASDVGDMGCVCTRADSNKVLQ